MTTRYHNLSLLSVMAMTIFLACSAVKAQDDSSALTNTLFDEMNRGSPVVPEYIAPPVMNRRASSRKLAGSRNLLSSGPVLTIYEDSIPFALFFGSNGTRMGLASINKVFGQDYYVQPIAALAKLSYAQTQIAWISTTDFCELASNYNDILPSVVTPLMEFLNAGGVAVFDLGTFCFTSRVAPKPDGSLLQTTLLFSFGPTALPANQAPTSLVSNPYSLVGISGNLVNLGTIPTEQLPTESTVHLLDNQGHVILATYKVGAGTVVVDTIPKEIQVFFQDNRVVRNLLQFAYDETNANMGCTANDYLCNNCKDRAAQNPAAFSFVGSCYNCALNLANSWQCYQCMSSSTNPDVVSGCLQCIADGVPSWSCPQWCAAAATTGQQMSSCETCLTTPGINTWGCFNCLSMAKGDINMSNQCNQCLYDGSDPWSCGQCLLKSDSTAVDTCFKCLPPIGGDTYPCLSA